MRPCKTHDWCDPTSGRPICGWQRYTHADAPDHGCADPCAVQCPICWEQYALQLEKKLEDKQEHIEALQIEIQFCE